MLKGFFKVVMIFLTATILVETTFAEDDISMLYDSPIYNYVMNNRFFDNKLYNSDILYDSTEHRVLLHICENILIPQSQLESKVYIGKIKNTENWHDEMNDWISAASLAGDLFAIANLDIDSSNVEKIQAYKNAVVDLYLIEVPDDNAHVISAINEGTDLVINKALDEVLEKKEYNPSTLTIYVLTETASIFNDILAAIEIYEHTEMLNTLIIVNYYIQGYYKSAGDETFLQSTYEFPISVEKAVPIIASKLSSTDFWGNLNYDKEKAIDRIHNALNRANNLYFKYNEMFGPFSDYASGTIEVQVNEVNEDKEGIKDVMVELYDMKDNLVKQSKTTGQDGRVVFERVVRKMDDQLYIVASKDTYSSYNGKYYNDFLTIVPSGSVLKTIELSYFYWADDDPPEFTNIEPCPDYCFVNEDKVTISGAVTDLASGLDKLGIFVNTGYYEKIIFDKRSPYSVFSHEVRVRDGYNNIWLVAYDVKGWPATKSIDIIRGNIEEYNYSDVSDDDPYYPFITILSTIKARTSQNYQPVVNGYEGNIFKPDALVNRAEFSKMLYIAAKKAGINFGNKTISDLRGELIGEFEDLTEMSLPVDEWYIEFVGNLFDYDAISGYPDGQFKPHTTINMAEMMKMIIKTFYPETQENGVWYMAYLNKAEDLEIKPIYENDKFTYIRDKDHTNVFTTRKEAVKAIYDAFSAHEN